MNDKELAVMTLLISAVALFFAAVILGMSFGRGPEAYAFALLVAGYSIGAAAVRLSTDQPFFGQTMRLWRARRAFYRERDIRAAMRISAGEHPDRAMEMVSYEMAREAQEAPR